MLWRFCGTALAGLLLLAGPALGAGVEHTVDWLPRVFPIHSTGEVEVHVSTGRVHVVAGPEGRIVVSASLRTVGRDVESAKQTSRASRVVATAEGDKVRVDCEDPPHGSTSFDVRVEVPPHAQVRVRAGHAAIEAAQLAGPLDLSAKSGSVQVTLAGPATVHAETHGGKIDQDLGLQAVGRGKHLVADGRVAGGGPPVTISAGGAITIRAAQAH